MAGAEEWRELVTQEPHWWQARKPVAATANPNFRPDTAAAALRHWMRVDYEKRREQLYQVY
jgi:hypothetical protein